MYGLRDENGRREKKLEVIRGLWRKEAVEEER